MADDFAAFSADDLMDSVRRRPDEWVAEGELERLRPDFEREAARLNEMLTSDPILRAKLSAGSAFTMSVFEPAVRPYVGHVIYSPET